MSRNIQSNPRYYWAVINPHGHLWPLTCSYHRPRAIAKIVADYNSRRAATEWQWKWCNLYRRGFRAVKVTIRHVVRTQLPP